MIDEALSPRSSGGDHSAKPATALHL
jgi:hypothetical protein